MNKTVGLAKLVCFGLVAVVSAGAHCSPTTECFKDIGARPILGVALGEQVRSDEAWPSCGGIDGVLPGATLDLHLVRHGEGFCEDGAAYRMDGIDGLPDVTLDPNRANYEFAFAVGDGDFSSSQSHGCRGTWGLEFGVGNDPPSTLPVSPLDGQQKTWFVTRDMTIAQAQFCSGIPQQSGSFYCKDTFAVTDVVEVAQ